MQVELSTVWDTLERDGFAVLQRYAPELPSTEACSPLGSMVRLEGLNLVQSLTPREVSDAQPNTYSGNFGTDAFPLHTDLAHWAVLPHYFALRCIRGAQDVPTLVLDGLELISALGRDMLHRTLVQPRRPLGKSKLPRVVRNRPPGALVRRGALPGGPAEPARVPVRDSSWQLPVPSDPSRRSRYSAGDRCRGP